MTQSKKIALIIILLLAITIWHYSTNIHLPLLHLFHRLLYFIPIVLAAYWFGVKGGLTISVTSSILFLPKMVMHGHALSVSFISNVVEILSFNLVAFFLGKYQDLRKSQFTKVRETLHGAQSLIRRGHDVMVCIDNSPNALKAAQYVADNFEKHKNSAVSIIGFVHVPASRSFPDPKEYNRIKAENERTISELTQKAYELILAEGFPPEAVKFKTVMLQGESTVDKIMEELRISRHDTVVLGGTKMSKAEEFVLGNVAVKLVREAYCPVITVF